MTADTKSEILKLTSVTLSREKQDKIDMEFERYSKAVNYVIRAILKKHISSGKKAFEALEEEISSQFDRRTQYVRDIVKTCLAKDPEHVVHLVDEGGGGQDGLAVGTDIVNVVGLGGWLGIAHHMVPQHLESRLGDGEWRAGEGDPVEVGTKVVTLGGVNRIPVVVNLFEGQGAWIDRGQRITVRIPTMPGTEYEGQVDRTDREINFSTRTLPVYVGFSSTNPRIRYGMLVEVTIHASARENVLRIPREALIRTGESDRVILARGNGRFQPVSVEAGIESGDYIEILSGLEQGQEIVVSGQFLIDSESSLMADFRRMEAADDR